ncbi:acyltransferase family protein [Ktedonosporobacter rubrisoli]|uniref:acyltransferase family protein n=1 Tax=Ktedonosporobacter rubrisoli TaxID=2509675 RepID=UPI0013EE6498|nr:acyltransferase [Ktedonosporobacter rubrisoli]
MIRIQQPIRHGYLYLQHLFHMLGQWLGYVLEGNRRKSTIAPLDGIRAIACLSVVAYHLTLVTTHDIVLWKPDQLPPVISALAFAGDTGVTLFFLLSGFLLFLPYAKSLLFDAPWPSMRFFYFRRALRILPAYYVTLLLMILLEHHEYLQRDHLVRLGLFLTLFMDSFPQTYRELNGPFWSLAVEWQFYLLLPFLALAIAWIVRRGSLKRRVCLLMACLSAVIAWGLLSRYGGIYLTAHPDQSFLVPRSVLNVIMPFVYGAQGSGLHGKFLEDFAVGMLLSSCYTVARALPPESRLNELLRRLHPWLWVVGLLWLLVMACWKFNLDNPHTWLVLDQFPPVYNYVSELGFSIGYGLCIAAILFGASWLRAPFEWSPLRWLGILSYGLYMWHLKLLEFFTSHFVIFLQGWWNAALYSLYWGWLFVFIVPCMFLLFVLVEKPWVDLGNKSREREQRSG